MSRSLKRTMTRSLLAVALLTAVFAAGGLLWPKAPPIVKVQSSFEPSLSQPIDQTNSDIVASLQAQLDDQRSALAILRAEFDTLVEAMTDMSQDARQTGGNQLSSLTDNFAISLQSRLMNPFGPNAAKQLVEAGISPELADDLMAAIDGVARDRLELRYEAARDGWLNSDRYRRALGELPDVRQTIEQRFGEDTYDLYLNASGRPNRLMVRDVFVDSSADQLSLQPGDAVIRLDGKRIYSMGDVTTIMESGTQGEIVAITILREGEAFDTYVPRGPLGIRGQGTRSIDRSRQRRLVDLKIEDTHFAISVMIREAGSDRCSVRIKTSVNGVQKVNNRAIDQFWVLIQRQVLMTAPLALQSSQN